MRSRVSDQLNNREIACRQLIPSSSHTFIHTHTNLTHTILWPTQPLTHPTLMARLDAHAWPGMRMRRWRENLSGVVESSS
jgi:hypothetical protein